MRKGQFFFNYLRPFFNEGDLAHPYPNCHNVFFNLSDEHWETMEKDYEKFKNGKPFEFPKKPFGGRLISKEHESALDVSIREMLKSFKDGLLG